MQVFCNKCFYSKLQNISLCFTNSSQSTSEYRKEVSALLPSLIVLDDYELGGRGGELGNTEHRLLGNTGHLNSEIKVTFPM